MLHLVLTLQLLAPPAVTPLAVDPGIHLQQPGPSLLARRLSIGAGVLAGQGAAVGLAAASESLFGDGHLDPLQPTYIAGLTFIAAELVLVPVTASLGAVLATPRWELTELLGDAAHVRGIQGALLAAYELVAAMADAPMLALAGVLVFVASDVVVFPLVLGAEPPPEPEPSIPATSLGFRF